MIFKYSDNYKGSTLLIGIFFFAFQIYCDFSGYSDIAIGTSRLFGFDLMRNFAFPYFSRDIAEFWRRWHISLSTWFRDYLYIPLGGSHKKVWIKVRNIFIVFIVSGFWHGANWTFIVWGFLNAIYFLPLMILNKNRQNLKIVAKGKYLPSLKELISILFTFGLTVIAWTFFRADSVNHAFSYLSKIFSNSLLSIPEIKPKNLILLIIIFTLLEWFGREEQFAFSIIKRCKYPIIRYLIYYLIALSILILGNFHENQFIYFQF